MVVYLYCFCLDEDGIFRVLWYFVIVCWDIFMFEFFNCLINFWLDNGLFFIFWLINFCSCFLIIVVEIFLLFFFDERIFVEKNECNLKMLNVVFRYFLLIVWLIVDLWIDKVFVIFFKVIGFNGWFVFKKKVFWWCIIFCFICKIVFFCWFIVCFNYLNLFFLFLIYFWIFLLLVFCICLK